VGSTNSPLLSSSRRRPGSIVGQNGSIALRAIMLMGVPGLRRDDDRSEAKFDPRVQRVPFAKCAVPETPQLSRVESRISWDRSIHSITVIPAKAGIYRWPERVHPTESNRAARTVAGARWRPVLGKHRAPVSVTGWRCTGVTAAAAVSGVAGASSAGKFSGTGTRRPSRLGALSDWRVLIFRSRPG
jgi:hypothetical protein